MKNEKSKNISLYILSPLLFTACLEVATAEDLGIIQVESSTILDRLEGGQFEPSSTASISGDTIDAAHVENIQQLLQGVAGITTEIQGGDSLKIHIRGVDNQAFMGENPGVAVVIDGVPVFERTGRVNIDLDNIESIKVIKGGASYLYGNDALGGAVIITTKKGADEAKSFAGFDAGSYGYVKGVARTGFRGDNFSSHIQASTRQAEGYHEDSNYRADYLDGKLQYYLSDVSDLTFGLELSERDKNSHGTVTGLTAAETDPRSTSPDYNDYATAFDVELQKYFLTYNHDIGNNSSFMLNTYQFTDQTAFISSPKSSDPDTYQYGNNYLQVQQGVKSEWRRGGERHAWMAGLDLRANSYKNHASALVAIPFPPPGYSAGDTTEDNQTQEAVQALYAEYKYRPTSKWTLTTNARVDSVHMDYVDNLDAADSGIRQFNIPSARVGANYSLNNNSVLFANLSSGFRIPTIQELFTGRYSLAGSVLPNPDLQPEQALNVEIGMRKQTHAWGGPLSSELSLFQIQRNNYVLASSGLYAGDAGSQFDNIGGVLNQGLELTIKHQPTTHFSWNLAYTWLDARYTQYDNFTLMLWNGSSWDTSTTYNNTGNRVPRVPEHHINLSFDYLYSERFKLTTEIDTISSYYADEINTLLMPGRTAVNLLAAYDIRKKKQDKISVFLRIDNLLNDQYFNTARAFYDSNKDGVFDGEDISLVVNPGLTWTLGMTADF